ncbi:excalibur calcium-binding domain-containing protein, partial [Dietzia sp. CQ4]|uniref:excalibur calcium-binding domain-containing protein n=1 Tax=Dietzia sp. (strain CQ4) TaxID=370437 RepID=UPI0015F8A186
EPIAPPPPAPVYAPPPAPAPQATYFANCDAARAAGAAPIMRGEPGYAPKLDRDNDGVACE